MNKPLATYDWPTTSEGVIQAFADTPGEITVDKLLDYADVQLEWYIPSLDAIKFINFIRLTLGEEPENSNPKAHYFLIDCIFMNDNVKPYFEARGIDFDELKGRVVVLCTREFAKALTLDTEVATPKGYVTIKDIQEGDIVYDRDGKETKVLKKSGMFFENTYKTTLSDGRVLRTSYNHDNIVWEKYKKQLGPSVDGKRKWIYGYRETVKTTEELYGNGFGFKTYKNGVYSDKKYFIPRMTNPIEFPACNFALDPYTVGVILGDGRISKLTGYTTMTCHKDDFDSLTSNIPYKIGKLQYKKDHPDVISFGILGIGAKVKQFVGTADSYRKRVPAPLLTGSVAERTSVLQGLMDTDGTVTKKGCPSFTSTSKGLAEDVLELVRTLGGTGTISEMTTKSSFGKAWRVNISINNIVLFRLDRKASRQNYVPARDMVGIENIELIASEPTRCLTVDSPTQSFILRNGVVTHNSVLIIYLMLYMAAEGEIPNFGKVSFGIYVSDSMRGGVETTMTTMGKVYHESEYLQSLFEDVRLIQTEVNFVRKPRTPKEIAAYKHHVEDMGKDPKSVPGRMKRTLSIKGIGASMGGRGSRDGLARPEFAIFDDMVSSEKEAESPTVLANIESTIEADVLKALSGKGNFAIAIGTPYNKKDPIYRRIEEGSWLPVVFPRALKPPIDGMKPEEFKSVWPDRHTFKQCRKDYTIAKRASKGGNDYPMRSLMQENYLRIANDADRLIPESQIQWYSRQDIVANMYNYNWYITTDFTSTGRKGSDFSGMAVWAVGSNGDYFMVDLTLRKMELEEQYNELFRHVNTYSEVGRGIDVGIEIDGQQNIHILALKDRMIKRNEWFTVAKQKGAKPGSEGIRSRLEGGNKHWRLRSMLPLFQNRKIWFPKELEDTADMRELMEEIKYTSYSSIGSKHDDGLDLISQLGMIDIIHPIKGMTEEIVGTGTKKRSKRGWMWGTPATEEEINNYDSYA